MVLPLLLWIQNMRNEKLESEVVQNLLSQREQVRTETVEELRDKIKYLEQVSAEEFVKWLSKHNSEVYLSSLGEDLQDFFWELEQKRNRQ